MRFLPPILALSLLVVFGCERSATELDLEASYAKVEKDKDKPPKDEDKVKTKSAYVAHPLIDLGGDRNNAYAINNAGIIVGESNYGPGRQEYHAVIWNDINQMAVDINPPSSDGYEYNYSSAYDINENGQVLIFASKYYTYSDGEVEVYEEDTFIWTPGTDTYVQVTEDPLEAHRVQGYKMNDLGQVVGWARTLPNSEFPDGERFLFFWTENGGMEEIVLPDDTYFAYMPSVNSNGLVAGFIRKDDQTYSTFIWSQGGGYVELLGESEGGIINDLGVVVGHGDDGLFLWENGHAKFWPDFTPYQVNTITNQNEVTGMWDDEGRQMGFLWTEKAGPVSMPWLDCLAENCYSQANASNLNHDVVGPFTEHWPGRVRVGTAVLWTLEEGGG